MVPLHFRSTALLALFATARLFAQQGTGDTPVSLRSAMDLADVAEFHVPAFDLAFALVDDEGRAQAGRLPLYGRFLPVGVGPGNGGTWMALPDGRAVWRILITSDGAMGTELFFTGVQLPEGARLDVYDPSIGQHFGGFGPEDISADGSFTTPLISGPRCVVEYSGPVVNGDELFTIAALSHVYRDVQALSGTCEVDVACSEGTGWEQARDAVVRIRVVVPEGTGRCTGTLMNNTALDCRPFVLTAMHCGDGSTTDQFNAYQFFFNHQRAECGVGSGSLDQVLTGCVKRAGSNDIDANGRAQGSDFLLLELNDPIPEEFNAYYAGWDATGTAVAAGRCIHHPDGDVKKISTFDTQIYTAMWGTTTPDTHWRVAWAGTVNGHGVTEPGSSGAPLLNNAQRVIGTLTGGSSCCTLLACGPATGPNVPDYFGKVAQHWSGNNNPPAEKLKAWLAPGSSATTLDGSYDPCGIIGVEEHEAVDLLQLFPNPSSAGCMVQWDGNAMRVAGIRVTDVAGRWVMADVVHAAGRYLLRTEGWSEGLYTVQLLTTDGVGPVARLSVAH